MKKKRSQQHDCNITNITKTHTLLMSFVKTPDASPYSVLLALCNTPSISLYMNTKNMNTKNSSFKTKPKKF